MRIYNPPSIKNIRNQHLTYLKNLLVNILCYMLFFVKFDFSI